MAETPITLLLVAESQRRWDLPESLVAGRFLLCHATPAGVEDSLRQAGPEAALIRAHRYSEALARSMRSCKALRPKTQFFLLLEQTPPTRGVVALMHAGCQEVLEQSATEVEALLQSVAERVRFVRRGQMERLQAKQSLLFAGLVGESLEMIALCDELLRASRLTCPVLLSGETGTGKGLAAHAIHALSERNGKPFVTVDCGCLAPTLIESELYGVVRGAYTGADSDRTGLVEAAQEGTLFLDEVGELPVSLQPKLLRLLEEGEVRRLGAHRSTAVDIRVISATSRQLEGLVSAQQFRSDLFYRLNVLAIELPPLRRRRQDIPLLARHFASRHLAHGEPLTVAEDAIQVLSNYSWPGNVRELKNAIESAVAASGSSLLQEQHLPKKLRQKAEDDEPVNLRQLERRAIQRALELAAQDKARAAQLLGIGRTTLYRKLK